MNWQPIEVRESLSHTFCARQTLEHEKKKITFLGFVLSACSLGSQLVLLKFMFCLVLKYYLLCASLQNVSGGWSASVCIDRWTSQGTTQTRASEWNVQLVWQPAVLCGRHGPPPLAIFVVAFSAIRLRPPLDLPLNERVAATIERLMTKCRSRQRARPANVTWSPPWAGSHNPHLSSVSPSKTNQPIPDLPNTLPTPHPPPSDPCLLQGLTCKWCRRCYGRCHSWPCPAQCDRKVCEREESSQWVITATCQGPPPHSPPTSWLAGWLVAERNAQVESSHTKTSFRGLSFLDVVNRCANCYSSHLIVLS